MEDILLKDGILEALEYINKNGFSEVISTKENVKLSSKDLAELMDLGLIEVRMSDSLVVFNLSDEGRKVLRGLKRS